MATGGKKRTRSERVAALELPPGKWKRAWVNVRRGDVLLRIGLAILTAIILCVVLRGWHPPLTYRAGDVPSRDVLARVSFSMADPEATRVARQRADRQVRAIFTRDSAALDSLVDQLDNDEKLAPLKSSVVKGLAPFRERGLLNKLPYHPGQGNLEEIVIHRPDDPDSQEIVPTSDVLIGDATAVRESLAAHLPSDEATELVFAWIRPRLVDTLSLDETATSKTRAAAVDQVEEVVVEYFAGQTLAVADERLSNELIRVIQLEHSATLAQRPLSQQLNRALAVVAFIGALFALCALYLHYRERRALDQLRRLMLLLGMVVVSVAVARWVAVDAWSTEIIPLLLFGMTVAIAYRQEMALLFSSVVVLIVVLGLGEGLGAISILMGVSVTAILQVGRIRNRSKLVYVGGFAALAAFGLTVISGVLENQPVDKLMMAAAGRNALWTLIAGFLMTGLLPFIERTFRVLTDVSLLELGDLSNPLLQELVRRAPSTYNHSIMVGSIGEAAADAIGARGLLVRVGAYYHDIGKMLKPEYFIENQPLDENRHESLIPAMSTLVIIAHIKDGANLARKHKLPESIIDFIEQHHGTTLVEFFFGRANEQRRDDPNAGEVDESSFRYPGPRPQTKETGVLMLADAAESACRSLIEPAPARIESLVHEVTDRKLADSQFDESQLTLRELRTVQDSMIKSLVANYHGRVKYPDQRTA